MICPQREVPYQDVCTVGRWVEYTTARSCDQSPWMQVWGLPLSWLVVSCRMVFHCESDALSSLFLENICGVASEDIRIPAQARKSNSFCSPVRLSPTWVTTCQSSYTDMSLSGELGGWLIYSDGKIDIYSQHLCLTH